MRSKLLHLTATWFQEEYFHLTRFVNNKPPFSSRSHEFVEFAAFITRKNWISEIPITSPETGDLQRFLQAAAMIAIMVREFLRSKIDFGLILSSKFIFIPIFMS